jgi:hypothetical protein
MFLNIEGRKSMNAIEVKTTLNGTYIDIDTHNLVCAQLRAAVEDMAYLAGQVTTDEKCNVCRYNPNDMGCEEDRECHFEWRGLEKQF